MYRALIRILSERYRCIAVDYPGFGLSEKPVDYTYSLRGQSEALEALFDHLELERVILLGHDTGGASAFALALRRPEIAMGMILTDTVIFPVSEYPFIINFLNTMEYRLFGWVNRRFNLMMQITSRFAFKTIRLSATESRVYRQSFGTPEKREAIRKILLDLKHDEGLMQQIYQAFKEQWPAVPSLLMCGEKDKLVSGGVYDRIKKLLTNATTLLIPGEEHFPHEGQAELMARQIETWMDRHFVSSGVSNHF